MSIESCPAITTFKSNIHLSLYSEELVSYKRQFRYRKNLQNDLRGACPLTASQPVEVAIIETLYPDDTGEILSVLSREVNFSDDQSKLDHYFFSFVFFIIDSMPHYNCECYMLCLT